MGDIDIMAYDYCETKTSRLFITIIALTISIVKTVYKHVKLSINVSKYSKTYHGKCHAIITILHDYWQRTHHS